MQLASFRRCVGCTIGVVRGFAVRPLGKLAVLAIWLLIAAHLGHPADIGTSSRKVVLGQAKAGSLYAVIVSVTAPAQIQGRQALHVSVADARGSVSDKWLHSADLDFYLTLRARADGAVVAAVEATPDTAIPALRIALKRVLEPASGGGPAGVIAAEPNASWQQAQGFEFGQTIFGSADDRPYAPAPAEDAYLGMLKGFHWFRFTFHGKEPRLAYFVLTVTDRDVPLDVDIFTLGKNGADSPDVVPYHAGESVYRIEATQNYPELYNFRTRILKPEIG